MKTEDSATNLAQGIGLGGTPSRRRTLTWLGVIVLLALAGAAATLLWEGDGPQVRFVTAPVERGDLSVKVTATGTLQPITQVEVGTEVSGTIETVAVDFNDRVKKGQVMARLDQAPFLARFRQSKAALALAEAGVHEAQATVTETAAKLKRVRNLINKRLSSEEELDTIAAANDRAIAALALAHARVEQAQAQVDESRRTLDKTEIRSPIDGTVLKRQVEPGQTVAASLQTPVLFTLAEDLRQMELNVAIDEADVGQVAAGQDAEFTVDAYPNRRFPATITQVRFAPATVDGVVTYAGLLELDNQDLLLRPGMTATAEIMVREVRDAVLVPNPALRFTPPRAPPAKGKSQGLVGLLLPGRVPDTRRDTKDSRAAKGSRVWVLKDGAPAALEIKTGATDGTFTEVLDSSLEPGTQVLVDVERKGARP